MNTGTLKFILAMFSIYATMQVTKDMNIAELVYQRDCSFLGLETVIVNRHPKGDETKCSPQRSGG